MARLWILESWRTCQCKFWNQINRPENHSCVSGCSGYISNPAGRAGTETFKNVGTPKTRRLKPSFWVDRLDCAMSLGLGADWWVSQTSSQLCFWRSYCNFFKKEEKESISINQKQHFLTIYIHMTSLGEKVHKPLVSTIPIWALHLFSRPKYEPQVLLLYKGMPAMWVGKSAAPNPTVESHCVLDTSKILQKESIKQLQILKIMRVCLVFFQNIFMDLYLFYIELHPDLHQQVFSPVKAKVLLPCKTRRGSASSSGMAGRWLGSRCKHLELKLNAPYPQEIKSIREVKGFQIASTHALIICTYTYIIYADMLYFTCKSRCP